VDILIINLNFKKMKRNLKSSKLLKQFEIGKNLMTSIIGGTEIDYSTPYSISGSESCSASCPDFAIDHRGGGVR
jgi:hypothetical protein